MSKRQMRSMLRNEGLGYALLTILCALTAGSGIVYCLFSLIKNAEETARFTYPVIPVLAICIIISLVCLITPEIIYIGISKMSLVERLREIE